MPKNPSEVSACAAALRAAADRGAPHEKTLYYRVQAVMTALNRTGGTSPATVALGALSGQIGERLEDDAIPATDLPFWRDIAERMAAILDLISTDDDAVLAAVADLMRQLDPPAVRH